MADEPMIPATSEHPAIYRDGHRLTANKPAPPRSARDGETLSDEDRREVEAIVETALKWPGSLPSHERAMGLKIAALRAECARLNEALDAAALSKQEILDAVIAIEQPRRSTVGLPAETRKIRRALDRIDSRLDSPISRAAARAAAPTLGETNNG